MSDPINRSGLLVDGMVHHWIGGNRSAMACGLIVHNRSLDAILKMFIDGTGRDIDCMTCLVAEARNEREP